MFPQRSAKELERVGDDSVDAYASLRAEAAFVRRDAELARGTPKEDELRDLAETLQREADRYAERAKRQYGLADQADRAADPAEPLNNSYADFLWAERAFRDSELDDPGGRAHANRFVSLFQSPSSALTAAKVRVARMQRAYDSITKSRFDTKADKRRYKEALDSISSSRTSSRGRLRVGRTRRTLPEVFCSPPGAASIVRTPLGWSLIAQDATSVANRIAHSGARSLGSARGDSRAHDCRAREFARARERTVQRACRPRGRPATGSAAPRVPRPPPPRQARYAMPGTSWDDSS